MFMHLSGFRWFRLLFVSLALACGGLARAEDATVLQRWLLEKSHLSEYQSGLAQADEATVTALAQFAIDHLHQADTYLAHLTPLFARLEQSSPRLALRYLAPLQLRTQSSLSEIQEALIARWQKLPPATLWSDLPFLLQSPQQAPLLTRAIQAALAATVSQAPTALIDSLQGITDATLRRETALVAAHFPWGRDLRPALSAWFAPLAADPAYVAAITAYTLTCAQTDPVAAYRWVYALPTGPCRHQALVQLFHLIGLAYPRIGVSWFNREPTRHALAGPDANAPSAWPETTLARDLVAAYAVGLVEKQPEEGPLHFLRGITDSTYGPLFEEELLRALRPNYPELAWDLYRQLHPN